MEENISTPQDGSSNLTSSSNKTPIYVAAVVVVGLVLLGAAFLFNRQTKPSETTQPPVSQTSQTARVVSEGTPAGAIIETVVIEKSDSGFSPETVKVKKGTMVKFVNKSKNSMWVASAPHPTHTDYPEFDQKATGDSFGFLFMKVGSWKFHNHSPFGPGGTVVVTE